MKPQPPKEFWHVEEALYGLEEPAIEFYDTDQDNDSASYFPEHGKGIKCPYGEIGNVLWVRESFQTWKLGWIFKSDYGAELPKGIKWKPSIHMPRTAARIFLEITNIRVERVQDISEEDAIKEGIEMNNIPHPNWYWMEDVYSTDSPTKAFELLWNKINGTRASWEINPWVWVIELKRIEK